MRTILLVAFTLVSTTAAFAQTNGNGGSLPGNLNQPIPGTGGMTPADIMALRMLRGRSHGVKTGQPQIYDGFPGMGQTSTNAAANGQTASDSSDTDKRTEAKRLKELRKESAKAEAEKKAEEKKAKAEKEKAARIKKAKEKADAEKAAEIAKTKEDDTKGASDNAEMTDNAPKTEPAKNAAP
jgi:hypothetical protein